MKIDYITNKRDFLIGALFGSSIIVGSLAFLVGFDKVARAVTFDSDIVPVTGSSISLGVSPGQIDSINNTMFFNGQTVGIGGVPTEVNYVRLELTNGGLRFNNLTATSTCNSALRGTLWFTPGTGGEKDALTVCYWDGASYDWAEFRGK